jgi:hypothetical protein
MTSLRHLRSSTANKRPDPTAMVDGQLAMNYDIASPGLFFKDDNGTLIKVGPVHVGTTAPNVSPAAGGTAGNSIGEQWLDTTSGVYVLKVWDGSAWRSESGTFVDVSGDTMTGALTMANQQAVRFSETTANGSNYIALQADAALASNKTITLPDTTGTVVTTGDTGTVTSTMIANNTILNADVNASAAIAGTKVSPDFGSQTIVTTGIFSSAAGTAAAPSIAFTGDTNTGIYSPGADQLAVATNGTGRLFVDSAGLVGIGTSAPDVKLHVATGNATGYIKIDGGTSTSATTGLQFRSDSSTNSAEISSYQGDLEFITGVTERLRITSAGLVGIGTSAPSNTLHVNGTGGGSFTSGFTNALACISATTNTAGQGAAIALTALATKETAWIISAEHTSGNNGDLAFYCYPGGASYAERMRINNAGELLVGYTADNGAYKLQVNSQIFATSATVATSDGRYKENVATLDGCVDLVKALRPVSFNWKEQQDITRIDDDGNEVLVREGHNFPDGTQVGFIAQEVEEVLSDKIWLGSVIKQNVRPAVTDNDGNELAPEEEFLGIAEGNLVAVLTSALKDAIGRIESLEAEVAALNIPLQRRADYST